MYSTSIKGLLKNKIVKETIWSLLSKASSMVLFLLINIILARKLDITEFGQWSFFLSVTTIISTLSYFGINNASGKLVALYDKTDSLKGVIASSLKLRLVFSAIFSILLFLLRGPLAVLLAKPGIEGVLLYGAPLVFFSGTTELLKEIFAGLHRIKYNFIVNIMEYGLKLSLILLFLAFYSSVKAVAGSFSLALGITSIFGLYLLHKVFYTHLLGDRMHFKKEILNYSFPFIFISFGFIALTELDTVMLGMFSSEAEVGFYSVAKQIILKLPHISLAIAMGTMPIFAKMNKENASELKSKFVKILKFNALLFFIISLMLCVTAPVFVPILFGNGYIGAVRPLQVMTVYLFIYANSMILSSFLDYTGSAKKRAINISATIIINVILNLVLVPLYGATGAAIAVTLAYIPYIIFNSIEVYKKLSSYE